MYLASGEGSVYGCSSWMYESATLMRAPATPSLSMRSRWATSAPNICWYHATAASRSRTAMPTWSMSVSLLIAPSSPSRSWREVLHRVGQIIGHADDGNAGLGVLVHLVECPGQ